MVADCHQRPPLSLCQQLTRGDGPRAESAGLMLMQGALGTGEMAKTVLQWSWILMRTGQCVATSPPLSPGLESVPACWRLATSCPL